MTENEDNFEIEPGALGSLLDRLKEKLTENPVTAIIAAFIAVLIVIIIISSVVSGVKKSAVKRNADPSVNTTEAVSQIVTETPTTTEVETTEPVISNYEANSIANGVYTKAYKAIDGGNAFANWDFSGEITYEKKTVKAYSVNIGSLKEYFTDKAINFIGSRFTDTPDADEARDIYGNTGTYYIFADGKSHASSFANTVFSNTDNKASELKVVFADNERIVATTETGRYGGENQGKTEYIIFMCVDGNWKIDSFEDFSVTTNTLELEAELEAATKVPETTKKTAG